MLDLMASFLVNCAFTFDNYADLPLLKEDRILHYDIENSVAFLNSFVV